MATLNTQKTRLDGQLKESSASIRKLTDEKKQIIVQLEEVSKNGSVLEQKLQEAKNKIEVGEKSMKELQEEMTQKLQENSNSAEGKTVIQQFIAVVF